jgi:hypothetical protein
MLGRFKNIKTPAILSEWLDNPVEDWNMAIKLFNHVKKSVDP